ncbi:hypothetical protein G6F16_003355 [Rhizopus arrhizus]|nr:hypothetical protein G6F21_009522 [Rhizopus arrhizus]KAG0817028.1 hypothetical protein G6F20_002724 [Rhizopus arrhizus]KAG0824924.1 hypothetical protein G6F19_010078 [Rhizopus arrhizus]KAG0826274.1 hypothetical protein G6F18_010037 [Rhizopus arrhizus]KAG0859994.1 hypothetical protein G6F17_001400 [Rhizopus arrhizus]
MLKPGSTRFHIDVKTQQIPVIFSYHQLKKKKEQKVNNFVPELAQEEDAFFKELLKKAESYSLKDEQEPMDQAADDDDEDDEGSDDDSITGGLKKKGNEYDFEDPFIDDSEMLLDESFEYDIPEIDGFFVYQGPLDANESTEEKKITTTSNKRRAAGKAKSATTTNSKVTKSRKKEETTQSNTTIPKTTNKNKKATTTIPAEPMQLTPPKPTTAHTTTTANPLATSSATATNTSVAANTAANVANTTTPSQSAVPPLASIFNNIPTKKTTHPTEAVNKSMPEKTSTPKQKKPEVNYVTVIDDDGTDEKKKKAAEPPVLFPLDRELDTLMTKIRTEAGKETFANKSKFPESLKPLVLHGGLICFRRNTNLDINYVHHLMSILPYNKFTLRKFVTTKSGQMRVDELQQEIDELAIKLKQTIDRMMPDQQQMYESKVAALKQEKAVKVATAAANNNGIIDVDALEPEEELETKFKCTDEVRKIIYDIMKADEQSNYISNLISSYRNGYKDGEKPVADGKARKLMYQRLLSCWPDGWMKTGEIGRQYSMYKKKLMPTNFVGQQNAEIKKRKRSSEDNSMRTRDDEEHVSRPSSSIKVESLVNV